MNKGEGQMPKVIAFLNGKGGVSKTTSAVNIATALARKGYKVVVVDTDPQRKRNLPFAEGASFARFYHY